MGCRLSVLNFTWSWQVDAIFTVWNIMQWGVPIRMAVAFFSDQSPLQHRAVNRAPRVFYWVGDAQHIRELEWQIDGSYGVHTESDTDNLNRCGCLCGVALLNNPLQHENGDEQALNFVPSCQIFVIYKCLTETGCFLNDFEILSFYPYR